MIGFVATDKKYRGQKLASTLLAYANTAMQNQGVQIAVLWTRQHSLYQRMGWQLIDDGVIGECAGSLNKGANSQLPAVTPEQFSQVDALYRAYGNNFIERPIFNYGVIPAAANTVHFIVRNRSYAIVGANECTAFVFDLGGDPAGLLEVFKVVRQSFAHIIINAQNDSPAQRLLSQQAAGITWNKQNLAMWKTFDKTVEHLAGSYIPFIDRI